jgi:hypothetical protein
VNEWIVGYLVIGAVFGLATFSRRHLFSEGPTRSTGTARRDALDGRIVWTLLCIGLWPIFALTGVYSLWRQSRKRR